MTTQNYLPPTLNPTARLLLDAFRAFENELAKKLSAKGFTDVTTGNFNILRHLNPEGMHLTMLAKDAQISKQAIGKMIKDLEKKSYVEIMPDKTDARAKCVHLTVKGKELIDLAISIVSEMEEGYLALLGKENYMNLRQSVSEVCDWHLSNEEK